MLFGHGKLHTVQNIFATLYYLFTKKIMLLITTECEKEVEIKSQKTRIGITLIRMITYTATYQKAHTFSRLKRIVDFAVQKSSSMNL